MIKLRSNRLLFCLTGIATLLSVGCTTAPVQEMSDARQAIAAARDADAARRTPVLLDSAEQSLQEAQQQLKNYYYTEARKRAIVAKAQAVQARREAEAQLHVEQEHAAHLAIVAAQGAIRDAAALDCLQHDTANMMKSAETAFQSGNYSLAQTQAAAAEQQALLSINQAYMEKARHLIHAAKSRGHLRKSQLATLKEAEAALRKQDGKKAYTLISQLH